jgi:predicted RNA-binding protein with TRAM domain
VVEVGQIVHVGPSASVQFAGDRRLWLRITRIGAVHDGMAWVRGYVVLPDGRAVERRDIYVIVDGLRVVPTS